MASEEEKKAADENSEKNKKASGSEDKENGNIKDLAHEYAQVNDLNFSENMPDIFSGEGKDDFLDENDPEDAILLKALQQYDDEMLDKFFNEEDDEKPIPLSDEGRENIKELFSQWIGPENAEAVLKKEEENYQKDFRRWKQKRRGRTLAYASHWSIRVAAAVFLMVICAVNTDSSLAFKLPEVGFEAIVGSDYSKLRLDKTLESQNDEILTDIKTYYYLSNTLEGYELTDKIEFSDLVIYLYISNNSSYSFSQQVQSTDISTNTEQVLGEEIDIMYGKAFFYQFNSVSSLVWNYQGYTFKIEGRLLKSDLIQLSESLKKEES